MPSDMEMTSRSLPRSPPPRIVTSALRNDGSSGRERSNTMGTMDMHQGYSQSSQSRAMHPMPPQRTITLTRKPVGVSNPPPIPHQPPPIPHHPPPIPHHPPPIPHHAPPPPITIPTRVTRERSNTMGATAQLPSQHRNYNPEYNNTQQSHTLQRPKPESFEDYEASLDRAIGRERSLSKGNGQGTFEQPHQGYYQQQQQQQREEDFENPARFSDLSSAINNFEAFLSKAFDGEEQGNHGSVHTTSNFSTSNNLYTANNSLTNTSTNFYTSNNTSNNSHVHTNSTKRPAPKSSVSASGASSSSSPGMDHEAAMKELDALYIAASGHDGGSQQYHGGKEKEKEKRRLLGKFGGKLDWKGSKRK